MNKFVLHQWEISPFCGKVRKALRFKGIDFDVINYNGLMARKAASLSAVGKLPVLDIDGQRLQDSSVILRYLESRYPTPALFPTDPADRAQALILEDWADESLYWYELALRMGDPKVLPVAAQWISRGRPSWERWLLTEVLKRRYPKKLKAQGIGRLKPEDMQRNFFELLDSLEHMLKGKQWLVGGAISIADIAVSSQLEEIIRTSPLAPKIAEFKLIQLWLKECK